MATGSRSGSLSSLREFNRLRLVDFLRTNGTASRAELARRTGLSRRRSRRSSRTSSAAAWSCERAGQFAGEGQPGRPAALLALDPSAAAAVGIDFDHDKVRVAVSDLSRSVLAEASAAHDVDHDAAGGARPRCRAGRARSSTRPACDEGPRARRGHGARRARSTTTAAPLRPSDVLPGWAGVDAADELEERLELPGLRRQRRQPRRARRGRRSAPGATRRRRLRRRSRRASAPGIVVDGGPTAAHRARPGEIGHVVVDPQGPICRCGNRGCLETLASGPALSSWCSAQPRRRADVAGDDRAGARRRRRLPAGDRRRRAASVGRVVADAGATCSTPRWS